MSRGILITALIALPAVAATDLDFAIRDGQIENHFFREGQIAAHVALSSGMRPNLIIAFPAGNTGVYAEFSGLNKFTLDPELQKSGNGVRAVVKTASKLKTLRFENFVLGNVRHIRNYEGLEKQKPSEINETATLSNPQTLKLERVLAPEHRYSMTIQTLAAGQTFKKGKDGHWQIEQEQPAQIEFAVTAETSEPPLTPFSPEQILKPEVIKAMDPLAVLRLQFLSYHEKFLAGSWRYLNFFFRDTALSTRLMFEALQPEAVETALMSIFERMNETGELAHEEALSDFAYYLSQKETGTGSFVPELDFKMIDNDFMLAPLVLRYFNSVKPERASRFLERKLASGKTVRRALRTNLVHVLELSQKFTTQPIAKNLVRFKEGQTVGQWRDSEFAFLKEAAVAPFDVNVALVPSALAAASEFFNNDRYGLKESENGKRASEAHKVWSEKAAGLFQTEIPAAKAKSLAVKFARAVKIKVPQISLKRSIKYFAIGLKANGEPIPVMNSDEAAYLLFGRPTEQQLKEISDRIVLPFPYGLTSSIGILISNTAFADAKTRKFYTRDHYHGLLVWGREQAMFALGLEEQLKRAELTAETRKILEQAQSTVWDTIQKTQAYQSRELWTWAPKNGQMTHMPYGQTASHHTSANPIQLWSEAGVVIRALHEIKTGPSRVASLRVNTN